MIIAIDGPAASGKGTLAKLLAAEFNLLILDTGKLYRLTAWRLLQAEADLQNLDAQESAIRAVTQNITPQDLTDPALLDEQIGKAASSVSAHPLVRQMLIPTQRGLARELPKDKNGMVADGRDIGTVIFPDADYKFFLTADIDIRAQRRHQELAKRPGTTISLPQVKQMLAERDQADETRALSPLTPAADAIHLNSSRMRIDEMAKAAIAHIEQRK